MNMTELQQKRLAEIRMRWLIASAETDTMHWESAFFLQVIDDQNATMLALS
jgi:hypothetical protein